MAWYVRLTTKIELFFPESHRYFDLIFNTVVGDFINIMKTTFDFYFYLYKAFNNMDTQKHRKKEKLSIKKASH